MTSSPYPDAVEAIRAVQGIVNTFLPEGVPDRRSSIPTPEHSPRRKSKNGDGREQLTLGGECGAGTEGTEAEENKDMNGGRCGINEGSPAATATTTDPAINGQAPQAACNMTGSVGHNDKMTSNQPSTPVNKPEQEHLLRLVDEINHSVSQAATDDTARIKVATAALELANTVRTPADTVMGWFVNMSVVSAVRLFLHWGAFEAIPAGPDERITYSDLARMVDVDEGLLTRIANMLTSARVLTHHPASLTPPPATSGKHNGNNPNGAPTQASASLSHTPLSASLRPPTPLSAMFAVMFSHVAAVSTILPAYFDAHGRAEPVGPAGTPMSVLLGEPALDYFTLLKRDGEAMRRFMLAMGMSTRRVPVTGVYEMGWVLERARVASDRTQGKEEEEGDGRAVWVDVGGGDGHTVREFLRVYGGDDGLKAEQCVVQDLEEVCQAAKEKAKEDEELRGVRWVAIDFLREAPIEGALVYYLRHILRDYSDPVSTTILSNVARSLTNPDARVLVAEQLNPDTSSSSLAGTGPGAGPVPLYAAFKDFSMLSIGGKERTLAQFAAVAAAAGLRVSGVFRDVATPHAVVELALKNVRGDN
ncbi:hypothetical protein VTK26DRAFT_7727 [Humicola hyalothermophila]